MGAISAKWGWVLVRHVSAALLRLHTQTETHARIRMYTRTHKWRGPKSSVGIAIIGHALILDQCRCGAVTGLFGWLACHCLQMHKYSAQSEDVWSLPVPSNLLFKPTRGLYRRANVKRAEVHGRGITIHQSLEQIQKIDRACKECS